MQDIVEQSARRNGYLQHVRDFALLKVPCNAGIALRVIHPEVDDPELFRLKIDVDTGHHTDAVNDSFLIPTPRCPAKRVLPSHQMRFSAVAFV